MTVILEQKYLYIFCIPMNAKKLLLIGLCSLTVLAGCNQADTDDTAAVQSGAAVTESTTPTTDITGIITAVTQGKDGVQITLKATDKQEYTTAVSMNDTIINGTAEDMKVGTIITVYADEVSGNILIGNTIEVK